MKLLGFQIGGEKRSASIENPTVPVSSARFLEFFGVKSGNLPAVTIDNAMTVPAVVAAVSFLSGSMANLPLHAYRARKGNSERLAGGIQALVNEAPNPEWTSFGWRKYMWQQVFTGGRGLSWIEREGSTILNIWPLDPGAVTVQRIGGRKSYKVGEQTLSAEDVIDVPFLLKRDQLSSYSPITNGSQAIALALAMNDYAGNFFAGGGVPPLALTGPLPQGADALQRAMGDIHRAIDAAKQSNKPVFPMPPGHELKQVGFDPQKGQMTDARRFQIEEIARIYNLPPVFLQDLTHGTFSNSEQQDLHLVKHLISQWAKAFEEEVNLKVFGRKSGGRYVEHNLDSLQRGDFLSRMNGLGQGIQNGLLTPNEGRALENRPALPNGDDLMIQGATVPLGSQKIPQNPAQNAENGGVP